MGYLRGAGNFESGLQLVYEMIWWETEPRNCWMTWQREALQRVAWVVLQGVAQCLPPPSIKSWKRGDNCGGRREENRLRGRWFPLGSD